MRFLLDEAEKIVCAALFLGMTAIGFANVVVRYGTNYSLAATEELLTNGFLLLTVFGAAIAARRGEHLAVTLVHDLLPRPLQKPLFVLSAALSVALLALSAWFAWATLTNQIDSGIRSYALGLPAWYYQAAVPFGFALILIRHLQHALDVLRGLDGAAPDVPHV
ncbi:TRAP transporter small permease [Rhodovulum euryhalinum]|uniref:TRAP transporter small permease protein n=1 Tax=Rhodovulum euryhalinum TaxID=35805 RepID=A0A4R2KEY1_9RHOB|nr:TRAP transporter small permease [Rhodovulum euryhalinum]TCO71594.1 TRAP-type C4-dicarboxylate transport system permease small subunit [Rhodovulum euryhalinum]